MFKEINIRSITIKEINIINKVTSVLEWPKISKSPNSI